MRRFRSFILALSPLFLMGQKTNAQFAYTLENFQTFYTPQTVGFSSGFTATAVFENINSYYDPTIVRVVGFDLGVSSSLDSFCSWFKYNPSNTDGCDLRGSGTAIRGNVQTGDIYFGPGDGRSPDIYDYLGGFAVDSCVNNCTVVHYSSRGLLGCQAMYPHYGYFYNGRTCDADGYDGKLFINVRFSLYEPSNSMTLFPYRASDLVFTPRNAVDPGPNAFVHVTPEPATWLLMATGIALVGATMKRRERRST